MQAEKTDYLQRNDKVTTDFLTTIIGARGQWKFLICRENVTTSLKTHMK